MRVWALLVWGASTLALAQTPHFWAEGSRIEPGDGPSELAGFEFGWTIDQSARACRRARHEFVRGTPVAVCSGVARDVHFQAKVRLRYCDERLCEVTAVVARSDEQTYAELLSALRRAFGSEVVSRVRDEEKRHYWTPGGFEAALRHRPQGNGLHVMFQSPARVLELSRTSD